MVARDQPGITASISGAFLKLGAEISQAHLFFAHQSKLAFDFFHIAPSEKTIKISELTSAIEDAIIHKKYVSAGDEDALPDIAQNISITPSAHLYKLRAETDKDVGALIYVLSCRAYRRLRANIYGLSAHTGKEKARVTIHLKIPKSISIEKARATV